jgi:hypothetical protein
MRYANEKKCKSATNDFETQSDPGPHTRTDVVKAVVDFVKLHCPENGSCTDYYHVERVRGCVLLISQALAYRDYVTLEIVALMHELRIWITDFRIIQSFIATLGIVPYSRRYDNILLLMDFAYTVSHGELSHNTVLVRDNDPLALQKKILSDAIILNKMGVTGITNTIAEATMRCESAITTLHNFREKFVRLRSYIHTSAGQDMAMERIKNVSTFYNLYFSENDFRTTTYLL